MYGQFVTGVVSIMQMTLNGHPQFSVVVPEIFVVKVFRKCSQLKISEVHLQNYTAIGLHNKSGNGEKK